MTGRRARSPAQRPGDPAQGQHQSAGRAPGPRPVRIAEDALPFAAEVAAYLADCASSPVSLDPAYHPTEAGALKLIFHRRHLDKAADQLAANQIRDAFRALTAPPARRTTHPGDGLALPAGHPDPDNPDTA